MLYQQGDVLIESVSKLPDDAKKINASPIVLDSGVNTHSIDDVVNCSAYSGDGLLFLDVKSPVVLSHEEHKPITIETGLYSVRKVREYDHFEEEIRDVED